MRMQVFLKKIFGDILLAAWIVAMLASFYFSREASADISSDGEFGTEGMES